MKTIVAAVASEARLPLKVSENADSTGPINVAAKSVRAPDKDNAQGSPTVQSSIN